VFAISPHARHRAPAHSHPVRMAVASTAHRPQSGPVTATPTPPPAPILDVERVELIRTLGAGAQPGELDFAGLVELFCQTAATQREAIRDAMQAGDRTRVAAAAHALRGAALQLGAPEVAVVCERISRAARAGAWTVDDLATLAQAIEAAAAALRDAVRDG
jgi:HPt (histidine-containing phosphotransfer) domain-containing protein